MKISIVFFVFALWVMLGVDSATQNAPTPSQDCNSIILTLADCLTFVTNGSTLKKPEGGCCSGLKKVLKQAPNCLCETFKNSGQLGIPLNLTKAMTLPSVCNVQAPPLSNCGLSVAPGAAPAHSPKSSAASPKSSTPTSTPLPPALSPDLSPAADGPDGINSGGSGTTTSAPAPAHNSASAISISFVALISMAVASYSHF